MYKLCRDHFQYLRADGGEPYMALFKRFEPQRRRVEKGIDACGRSWNADRAPYVGELEGFIQQASETAASRAQQDCEYCHGTGWAYVVGGQRSVTVEGDQPRLTIVGDEMVPYNERGDSQTVRRCECKGGRR